MGMPDRFVGWATGLYSLGGWRVFDLVIMRYGGRCRRCGWFGGRCRRCRRCGLFGGRCRRCGRFGRFGRFGGGRCRSFGGRFKSFGGRCGFFGGRCSRCGERCSRFGRRGRDAAIGGSALLVGRDWGDSGLGWDGAHRRDNRVLNGAPEDDVVKSREDGQANLAEVCVELGGRVAARHGLGDRGAFRVPDANLVHFAASRVRRRHSRHASIVLRVMVVSVPGAHRPSAAQIPHERAVEKFPPWVLFLTEHLVPLKSLLR